MNINYAISFVDFVRSQFLCFSLLLLRYPVTQEQINEYEAEKKEGQKQAVS